MYASIFGNTLQGVPSPYVPHKHPYPTRYHGPIFDAPRFKQPYRLRPYYVAPGLSASPDGIGELSLPSITRSPVADALLGALAGWTGAPNREDALLYALGGASLTYFGGFVGLGMFMSFQLWKNQEQGRLRPDLHGG
jgi:hypothetical protein